MGVAALTTVLADCHANGKSVEVRVFVDSGANYTVLPFEAWRTLDLKPTRAISTRLWDGTELRRQLGECSMDIEGQRATSPGILGELDDVAQLGAISLETVSLVLNPFTRTLHPMRTIRPTLAALPDGIGSQG